MLDFLQERSKNLSYSSVQGYVTAIGERHQKFGPDNNVRLGQLPLVKTWLTGLKKTTGIPRIMVPPWSLEVVLSALKKPPFEPLETCLVKGASLRWVTLKTVFLVAITSARRASEIHALVAEPACLSFGSTSVIAIPRTTFRPKVESKWHCNLPIVLPAMDKDTDPALHKLCVRRALKFYLEATKKLRTTGDASPLFLAYGKQVRGQPISKIRISQWLKMTVEECYKIMHLDPPEGVKGHQVRKQAVSWADMAGVDPQKICDAATWKSDNMFAQHYRLDIIHGARSDFGRRLLQLAASTAAEAALRRSLNAPRPPTGTGSLPAPRHFHIPKISKSSKETDKSRK